MTTTDPTPRRPWFQVSDELGGHDAYNRDAQLARWLTYTHANMLTFDRLTCAGQYREAVEYLHRALPAFTAAALTRGETPEWAYDTCVMGDTGEIAWDWLEELGINPDGIAPAADDESDALAQMTLAARAASMYLPEPERSNFRREYGLDEVTL